MKKFVPHLISVAIFIAISSIYFLPVLEGKVTIKTKSNKSKSDTSDMGDYVDFEEVDDY